MTEYNFRQLNSTDIFPVCNIISKIGIRELKNCFDGQNISAFMQKGKMSKNAMMAFGASIAFDVAGVVLANMQKCENEIYTLLASVTDLTEEALRSMPPADFLNMVIDFFKKEELQDFIPVVSKLLK